MPVFAACRALRGALAGIALAGLLAGCGTSGTQEQRTGPGTTVHSCGRTLRFDHVPERAVTLDQSATETLLALGLADRMAGTAFRKAEIAPPYRAAYEKVPVLSPKTLGAERLRAAAPDLAVSSFAGLFTRDTAGTREELADLGLPAYVSAVDCPDENAPGATPFDLLFQDYENYGRIFGVPDRAAKLIAEQRAALDEAARLNADLTGAPTVAWIYSVFDGAPYVAGAGGIPSAISRLAGVRNVFDDVDEQWPQVSWEAVAERDPDIIVLGDLTEATAAPGNTVAQKLAAMREHPTVSQLPAVRNNRIITVTGIEMDPGVRSTNVLRALVEGVRRFGHAG